MQAEKRQPTRNKYLPNYMSLELNSRMNMLLKAKSR